MPTAEAEFEDKQKVLAENNQHNLTNILRTKSEMGVFSDYPHFFKIEKEGK